MGKTFVELLNDSKEIAIFGFSELGKKMYQLIKGVQPERNIIFIDNAVSKQNCENVIKNEIICVYDPIKYIEENRECYFLIASFTFYKEMEWQLLENKVVSERIVYVPDIYMLKYELLKKKRNPRKKISFVVDMVEHCNLNCQNCDHFSPLAKEHFTDIDGFRSDMARMKEIFDTDITHIDLEGGEPLLNNNITEYIRIVREIFSDVDIQIFTNGLLLPKMKEKFWEVCKECDVMLEITEYPVNVDYGMIYSLADNYNIKYRVYAERNVSRHKPLDLEGKQDKYESFEECYLSNGECTMLKEGKLYPCTMIPNLCHFNHYFKKNLEVSKKDYIDIYSDVAKNDIYDFLCNPVPACRYCKVREWTESEDWAQTSYDIKEWT